MAITLGGTTLLGVQSEDWSKESNLIIMPMPLSDDDETFVIDVNGTQTTINVSGTFYGTETAVKEFAAALRAKLSGGQSQIDYVSEALGTVKVYLMNCTVTFNTGVYTSCAYSVRLVRTST